MVRPLTLALGLALASVATPANAVVTTSGCAGASSCTLAELFAGGSIAVNDVLFDGWTFGFEADGDTDEDAVFVTGIDETPIDATNATLGLRFAFDPPLSFEVAEYDFDLAASVTGGSTRTLTEIMLSLDDADGGDDGFVEVNADLSTGGLLSVDTPIPSSDSEALAGLTTLGIGLDYQMENFTAPDGSNPSLRQFSLAFQVTGERDDDPADVSAPTALSLLLLGLAGLAATRRRG